MPYGKGTEITTSDGSNAYVAQPTLRYDAKRDVMVSLISGAIYRDEGKGEFTNATYGPLQPGWRTYIGGSNFKALVRDPTVRRPFLNVLWWTFRFAAGTVLLASR